MSVLLGIIFWALLIVLVYIAIRKTNVPKWFLYASLIKVAAGALFAWVFMQFYPLGDFHYYNNISSLFQNAVFEAKIANLPISQSRVMAYLFISWPLYLMAFGNVWLLSIVFGIVSWLTSLVIARSILKFIKNDKILLVLLLPAFVFWCSGPGKETISMALLAMLVFGVTDFKKIIGVLSLIIGLLGLYFLKYYLFILFGGIAIWLMIIQYKLLKSVLFKCVSIIVIIVALMNLHPNTRFSYFTQSVSQNFTTNANNTEGVSSKDQGITLAFKQMIWSPGIKSDNHVGEWLAFGSNLLILAIGAFFMLKWRSLVQMNFKVEYWVVLLLILGGLFLVAYVTPNTGTYVRYESVFLPFIAFLLLYPAWSGKPQSQTHT